MGHTSTLTQSILDTVSQLGPWLIKIIMKRKSKLVQIGHTNLLNEVSIMSSLSATEINN